MVSWVHGQGVKSSSRITFVSRRRSSRPTVGRWYYPRVQHSCKPGSAAQHRQEHTCHLFRLSTMYGCYGHSQARRLWTRR
jgi:hypothetical protein